MQEVAIELEAPKMHKRNYTPSLAGQAETIAARIPTKGSPPPELQSFAQPAEVSELGNPAQLLR